MDSLPFASSSSSMIPTPPRSGHDKENVGPTSFGPSTPRKARIVFADTKEVFTYSPNLASRVADLSALGREPNKSNFKPSSELRIPFAPGC